MEAFPDFNSELKGNWFIRKIKKHQVITFTFGFLILYRLTKILAVYFADKHLFLEEFGLNIWFWVICIPGLYILLWLLATWVASKFPREKVKHIFSKHPISTIILSILYIMDLPIRLADNNDNSVVGMFEVIVYYAFMAFLWWLLVCWVSSKIFKTQKIHWNWYQKAIDKLYNVIPTAYIIILSLIVALVLFSVIFQIITVVFRYSGQDLIRLLS